MMKKEDFIKMEQSINAMLSAYEEKQIVEIPKVYESLKGNGFQPHVKKLSFVYVVDGFYTYKEALMIMRTINEAKFLNITNWRIPTENQLLALHIFHYKSKESQFKGITNNGKQNDDCIVWSCNKAKTEKYHGTRFCNDLSTDYFEFGNNHSNFKNELDKYKVFLVA